MLVAKRCLQYMTEAWPLDIIQAWHEDKELLGQVHSVHLVLSGSISKISERLQAMLIFVVYPDVCVVRDPETKQTNRFLSRPGQVLEYHMDIRPKPTLKPSTGSY
jgi:hypothetical protein